MSEHVKRLECVLEEDERDELDDEGHAPLLALEGLGAALVEGRYRLRPGLYAAASLDQATSLVTSVRLSTRPFAAGTPAAQVPRRFVAVASPRQPNPDLAPPR